MNTSKQKVWQAAKQNQLDEFIAKVAATFPDAIEYVVVDTPRETVWCKTKEDDV